MYIMESKGSGTGTPNNIRTCSDIKVSDHRINVDHFEILSVLISVWLLLKFLHRLNMKQFYNI